MKLRCRSGILGPLLLAALFGAPAPLLAAGKPAAASPARLLQNLSDLAQQRAKSCASDQQGADAPPGWRVDTVACAWQGRLQMRRWKASAQPDVSQCVSAPAHWWAWQWRLLGARPVPGLAAWRSSWRKQALSAPLGEQRRTALIEAGDGGWTATEWTWTPAPRAATRRWQARRWGLLDSAAAARQSLEQADATPDEAGQIRQAWERNLGGRAGEIGPDRTVWQADGYCMQLFAMDPVVTPLALPYAREDTRHEQRAAMQIGLARRYPEALFIVPFRVLDRPEGAQRGGAWYEAVWLDKNSVTGTLWLPTKTKGNSVRARIVVGLPEKTAGSRIAAAIDNELRGLARTWSAYYDR